MQLDPNLTHGMRGVVSCDQRMSKMLEGGGGVLSPITGFDHIGKTQAVG